MKLINHLEDPKSIDFAKYFDAYYSLIFSVILSKVNNFHDAEDICQEVFLRFYRKIDEIEHPRTWLHGCLRNVVFDYYKRRNSSDEEIELLFDDMSMGYVNGFRDARITITKVLQELVTEDREGDIAVFELVALHNFTFSQASDHLGISVKQARYRYNRATDRVRQKLKDKGINRIEDLL